MLPDSGLILRPLGAISMNEWAGRKGAGDHGTSFGPFMLHAGGALPRGKGRRWAESRAGVDYALRSMARAGAAGLRGQRAVQTIASRFEKPADIPHEVRVAMAHYGHGGGLAGRQAALSTLAQHSANGTIPAKPNNMAAIGALLGTINPNVAPIFAALAANQPQESAAPAVRGASAVGGLVHKAAINELFYDPLGGIKHNQHIGAVGGHNDHVHVSLSNAPAQLRAIAQAKRMGLRVGQDLDSNVTQVHVKDSYHYRKYNPRKPLRMAADVSGDPRAMSAFYKWVAANH
jgi:hypothetical protein